MSGWQRIGVVISVLWLVGLPPYIIGTTNSRANSEYVDCQVNNNGGTNQAAHNYCAHMRDLSVVSFSQVFLETPDAGWVWGIILAPIAALWIVGGIIFGTIRWIGRGFAKQ